MSTRTKNIIYGSSVLLILIGVLTFLILTEDNKDENTTGSTSSNLEILLNDRPVSDIVNISVSNQLGEYVVKNENDVWKVDEYQKFPNSKSAYDSFVASAGVISAHSKVEDDASNLEKYGLATPKAKVSTLFKDETSFEINLGNMAPDKSGYYMSVKDKKTVYIIKPTNSEMFLKSPLQFVDKKIVEDMPKDKAPAITKLQIADPNLSKPIIISKNPEVDLTSEENKSKVISAYEITSPLKFYADDTKVESILMGMYGLTAVDVVAVSPNSKKLEEYGFNKPTMTVTLEANSKTYTIKIGKGIEGEHSDDEVVGKEEEHSHDIDSHYVMLDGVDIVYKVGLSSLPWLSFDYKKVLSPSIVTPFIDNLKSISIKGEDKNYLMEFSDTGDNLKVKINGTDIDTAKYRTYYQDLLSVPIIELSDEKPGGKPKFTIEFNYKKESHGSDKVEFVYYSERKMGAILNNQTYFVVNREYVDKIAENTEKISNNIPVS